jgi:hypothetical protein
MVLLPRLELEEFPCYFTTTSCAVTDMLLVTSVTGFLLSLVPRGVFPPVKLFCVPGTLPSLGEPVPTATRIGGSLARLFSPSSVTCRVGVFHDLIISLPLTSRSGVFDRPVDSGLSNLLSFLSRLRRLSSGRGGSVTHPSSSRHLPTLLHLISSSYYPLHDSKLQPSTPFPVRIPPVTLGSDG